MTPMAGKATPPRAGATVRPKTAPQAKPDPGTPEGERIAKVLSRAGVSSRREAERLIELGEVQVNGKTISSPALNVTPKDKITVRGEPVGAPEPARLWLYYKPEGLVTSASDEKGRETVFDTLPGDMPRVMSVGRLDLNSEGLLLLTNDGELKRKLELPSTGWLRKYRVRVKGNPTDPELEPLRKGITLDGERFQPMSVQLDRHQGANAWLTVGLREGKNREVRRAIDSLGLIVNRLIRVSYGPFRLGDLEPGQVEEVKARVLREQVGGTGEAEDDVAPRLRSRGRTEGKTLAKPAPKPAEPAPKRKPRPAGPAPAPETDGGRPLKPVQGMKTLSRAWKTATTPDSGAKPARPTAKKSAAAAGMAKTPRAFGTARAKADAGAATAPRRPAGPRPGGPRPPRKPGGAA